LFGAVLLLRPHDSASAYNTGLALFNAGDKQKAHSYFARFVRDAPLTDPDLLRIRNWLVSQSVANPDDARSRPTQMDFAVNPDTGDGLFSGRYSVEGTARGGTFRFQFAE